ncbi:hypothetical protein MAPG_08537 [Magnaporthiopsis poae ATCC 64411]|uniref:Uncharacterized protein n=1 Tax=Magnaporthiopsis poae (strain ATCC 64411 / 73-15) TaxID=644358 RepID=A0A0C4E7M2_MAGP6|nr:hypothetical protein MAPG_08537 [Magnaporthiopsis poae ATCC 64411]
MFVQQPCFPCCPGSLAPGRLGQGSRDLGLVVFPSLGRCQAFPDRPHFLVLDLPFLLPSFHSLPVCIGRTEGGRVVFSGSLVTIICVTFPVGDVIFYKARRLCLVLPMWGVPAQGRTILALSLSEPALFSSSLVEIVSSKNSFGQWGWTCRTAPSTQTGAATVFLFRPVTKRLITHRCCVRVWEQSLPTLVTSRRIILLGVVT